MPTFPVLAATLAAATLLAACSDTGGDTGGAAIATAARPAVTSVPTSTSPGSHLSDLQRYVAGMRAFARCLRKAGYDVPDPDAAGRLDSKEFSALKQRWGTDPRLTKVYDACSKLIVPAPSKPLTDEQLASERKFARCLQTNGVPEWPDPVREAGSAADNAAGDVIWRLEQTAAFARASRICDPPNPHAAG